MALGWYTGLGQIVRLAVSQQWDELDNIDFKFSVKRTRKSKSISCNFCR